MIDGIEISNEHDARAYSRLYADDADLTTVIATTAHCREAIVEHIARVFENPFKKRPLPPDWVRSGNPGGVKKMGLSIETSKIIRVREGLRVMECAAILLLRR